LGADAGLGGFDPEELVLAGLFLLPSVKHDEVADQVQKTGLVAKLSQRSIQQGARHGWRPSLGRHLILPLHEELLGRDRRAVAQALGVVACQNELDGGEEALVEDLFLVGDRR